MVFYRWLKEFFENGAAALRKQANGERKHDQEGISALEAKLKVKNEHNGWIPRRLWLEDWEEEAIALFHLNYRPEGYRHLVFRMLDANVTVR